MPSLAEILQTKTREGILFESLGANRLRCTACGHLCRIPEGALGVCKVRFNREGKLMVPYGYIAGAQCDPVEKKPFFHVHPGSSAFSFGMLGCDLHCSYCQNWLSSQALRDPRAGADIREVSSEYLATLARKMGAESVISTYNEPLITSEWAVSVFKHAKAAGLMTGFVSNGNATPQVLDFLRPWTDLFKIDLKTFDDRKYRKLGGRLQPILDTIRRTYEMEFWLEIVTLLVPGFNDSRGELTQLTEFIAGVSPEIPWHVTAFHRDYRMTNHENTEPDDLLRAAEIGRAAGLRFVYAGNLPGCAGKLENTYCPDCAELLVQRRGFHVLRYELDASGCCPSCSSVIPGKWTTTRG